MFYKMIERKRDAWMSRPDCPIRELVVYMNNQKQMRDAQIEAIKTYLFLKIAGSNRPLHALFLDGFFNNINVDSLEVSLPTRDYLARTPAALALYEYATLQNDAGEQMSVKIENAIKKEPNRIDYDSVFKKMFYGVEYTDYLFSLPMGAGKTYLMAAFIYLDLYFAMNEPDNPVFAHNFLIFAPSGLKSSVVPSLKTIKQFQPSWIIPEPAASEVKRIVKFEVLDQNKTAKKSNKAKNPNVQKIALYQPFQDLFGLVTVTNAEKVILDRIDMKNGQLSFLEESDDDRDKQANELRNMLGKLPGLAVFIDEVHHAVDSEIKLRSVVNKWMENNTVNAVVGFSGTPYLEKSEKIEVAPGLFIASTEITNIVYYYPLINGIGNFLKQPVVKISNNANSLAIVDAGVRLFLDEYKDTAYQNGLSAKLAIYCGGIEKLEERVYPLVSKIAVEYGLNPTESILRFHKGNKEYPIPVDSQLQFDTLDKSISKIRIVLLVQIGKEGWDCTSLTGVILSQEGDSPTNMVLQTACRCLRQVDKGVPESALIYLNEFNGNKLNEQLKKQHHITIQEFMSGTGSSTVILNRYDRTQYLKLPKVDFYQLRVKYDTLIIDKGFDIHTEIRNSVNDGTKARAIILKTQTAMTGESSVSDTTEVLDEEQGTTVARFSQWLFDIEKSSFGFVRPSLLEEYRDDIKEIFDKITCQKDGERFYSSKVNRDAVIANIRKGFCEKRTLKSTEELVPQDAALLRIDAFKDTVITDKQKNYYPDAAMVENIVNDDKGKLKIDVKTSRAIEALEQSGNKEMADSLRNKSVSHPMKNHSFHYLPYKTDSNFEQTFLKEVLTYPIVEEKSLEVYYNGDRGLTEFKIRCFKGGKGKWRYIGMYTPDFLIIQRKDGKIFKALIVETKGAIYANDPLFNDKRGFVESEFLAANSNQYGYERFSYLYLEDSLPDAARIEQTIEAARRFFKEVV